MDLCFCPPRMTEPFGSQVALRVLPRSGLFVFHHPSPDVQYHSDSRFRPWHLSFSLFSSTFQAPEIRNRWLSKINPFEASLQKGPNELSRLFFPFANSLSSHATFYRIPLCRYKRSTSVVRQTSRTSPETAL